jgi:hypothetical protein
MTGSETLLADLQRSFEPGPGAQLIRSSLVDLCLIEQESRDVRVVFAQYGLSEVDCRRKRFKRFLVAVLFPEREGLAAEL